MEQMNLKEMSLTQLIDYYLKLESDVKKIDMHPQASQPAPKKAYTIDEWNTFTSQLNVYNKSKEMQDDGLKTNILDRTEIMTMLLNCIPEAHIWFLTDDKKYAYAKQCSNWPMDPPRLKFVLNPVIDELPELRLQIIN